MGTIKGIVDTKFNKNNLLIAPIQQVQYHKITSHIVNQSPEILEKKKQIALLARQVTIGGKQPKKGSGTSFGGFNKYMSVAHTLNPSKLKIKRRDVNLTCMGKGRNASF